MAVDYDPKKAHEYYMKHRKLKGRKKGIRSVKGFSQTQKEQWEYAKDQLSEEHKGIKKGITEDSKQERKDLSNRAKEVISQLRERLKNMPKEQRAEWKERISGMIDDIRGELRADKEQLTERTKGLRTQEDEAYEVRKDVAYNKIKGTGGKKK